MAGLGGFFLIEDTLSPLLVAEATGGLIEETKAVAESWADDILQYAKDNAPWEDRTGDARQGLDIEVDVEGDLVVITLFHTVDYGLWLEVIESGKWATIMPTLEHFSHEVMTSVSAIETGETLD